MNDWQTWIAATWPTMAPGVSVAVPAGLPSPYSAGFTQISSRMAEWHGQDQDWILSMPDGRLHVWIWDDGRRVAHRDAIDPAAGAVDGVAHWISETQTGGTVARVLIGLAVVVALALVFTKK